MPGPMGSRVQDRYRPELTRDSLGAFIRETGAFRIKDAILSKTSTARPPSHFMSGAVSPRLDERYVGASLEELQSITAKPQLMYVARDLAMARVGSWTTNQHFSW